MCTLYSLEVSHNCQVVPLTFNLGTLFIVLRGLNTLRTRSDLMVFNWPSAPSLKDTQVAKKQHTTSVILKKIVFNATASHYTLILLSHTQTAIHDNDCLHIIECVQKKQMMILLQF